LPRLGILFKIPLCLPLDVKCQHSQGKERGKKNDVFADCITTQTKPLHKVPISVSIKTTSSLSLKFTPLLLSNTMTPLTSTIATLLTLFAIIWYARRRAESKKGRPSLPPGPRGLPLIGNLASLDPDLHTYFAGLARTYGPILKLQLGSKLGIIVSSPNLAREVLKDHDITFANRDVPDVARIAAYGGSDIAWSPYGPEWRMLRKVCVLKMLSNSTLDSVYELRRREVRNIIVYIYSKPGSPINVGEQTFLTILNVVTSMLWGGTVQGEERGSLGAEFRRVVADMTELVGAPNISDFFPALARFDLQGLVKKMSGLAPKFDQIFDRMIEKQLSIDALGDRAGASSKDFLQFLLKVKDEGDVKTPLTMTHIKALLMVCFSLHDDNEMIRYACDCRSHYEASC